MKKVKLLLAMALVAIVFVQTANAQVTVTGSTGANATYAELGLAFAAINGAAQTGNNIVITISANTTEPASAVLNAGAWSTLVIYPTTTGLSISGNLEMPLIDLDGADNVTIDGRVNATGSTKNLIIDNTSTSSMQGTSTIRFINDATANTVKYCTLQGSSNDATAGVLFFSTTSGTTGNDDNTIDNNNITKSVNLYRPLNAVYSDGTAAKTNSDNTISNNNFYDFFSGSARSIGVFLYRYNTGWTIPANSFYETATFSRSGGGEMICIGVRSPTSTDVTISSNFIGGSAPGCGGTAWTKTSASKNAFIAIQVYVGPTVSTTTSVQGNTIKNFSWSDAATSGSSWTAIYAAGTGNINIGTVTGNTIGDTTGTGSIYLYTNATSGNNYGIEITLCTGTVDCGNNSIGAITTNTSNSTYPNNFYGIHKSATAGTTTISNNTIGSTSTANSINAASHSEMNAQEVFGIFSEGTGTVSISGNTVSKLTNATIDATTGRINGIVTTSGTNTISNNTVRDLTIANGNTAKGATASAIGIAQTSATAAAQTVSGNTIYNLSNTSASFAGAVTGLYYAGPATASAVLGNFIHSLSISHAANGSGVYGMYINGGTTTYSNNIIRLGDNSAFNIYGIQESDGINNFYFNTVYIGGAPATGGFSSIGANSNSPDERNFRNNLFINARSNNGATGTHYGAAFSISSLTIDYNDYIASGSGGVLGIFGVPCYTLDDIKAAYQNANSLNTDPFFANPTAGTAASDFIPSASLAGASGTGITIDYTGATRVAIPTMGAYDISNVWTGTAGTDWNTTGNWSANLVPTFTSNIAIPHVTNDPIVNEAPGTPAVCNNLSIAPGAVVTIAAGKALTVNGILANSGGSTGLVIKSTAGGTGSLLNNTAGVSGTVERYILAATWGEWKDGWHNLSSPVASQTISPEFVHGFELGTEDFYKWDEPTNYWINIKNSGGTAWTSGFETNFVAGRGYLAAYANEVTKNFTGTLNVADVTVSDLAISSGTNKSWHLLGNPYTSALTWDATTDWNKQNIGGVAKIWNEANQAYSDLTSSPTTVIPATNGFMVMVSSATGSLTLPATKRTHSAQGFYKSSIPHLQLVARNTNVGNAQESNIIFNPDATTGFDLMYDGEFLAGYGPQFYSVAGDEKLSTNSLPGFSEATIVPFSFIKNEGINFAIEATGFETLEPSATIYLKDNKRGINHNLSENPVYSFTSETSDVPARFELRFGSVGINETPTAQTIKAWYNGGILNVKTAETLTVIGIFNIQGQNLQNFQLYGSGLKTLQINLPAGVYFARIVNNGNMQTLKMIVQ